MAELNQKKDRIKDVIYEDELHVIKGGIIDNNNAGCGSYYICACDRLS